MALDAPRRTDLPQGDEIARREDSRDHKRAARLRLLTLAADLDDVGVHTRIMEHHEHPVVLRCWNPDLMRRAREVICVPDGAHGPRAWEFQYLLPVGKTIADATHALQPGTATEAAGKVRDELKGAGV
ncbi:hypothetical protein ACGFNU_05700 [Spirillospora sp. NPDC048911]|uniref:hypothetical protein n=1 Tax=Spirillospora sp. NPDC048911 TaxID=3364527 RepID=UPI003722D58A